MPGVQRMMRDLRKHAERDDGTPCRIISALGRQGEGYWHLGGPDVRSVMV
jgi:hypothetical protein